MLKGQIPRPLVLLFCCFKAERRGAKRSQLFYSARIRPSPLPITINHSPSMSTIPISLTLGLTAVTCTCPVCFREWLQLQQQGWPHGPAWPRMACVAPFHPTPHPLWPCMALHGPTWPCSPHSALHIPALSMVLSRTNSPAAAGDRFSRPEAQKGVEPRDGARLH